MTIEIEQLKDFLYPRDRSEEGPTSQIVSQQWTQAGHVVAPTSRQALGTATLNAVLTLAYENVGLNTNNPTGVPDDPRPLEIEEEAASLEIGLRRKYGHTALFIASTTMIQVNAGKQTGLEAIPVTQGRTVTKITLQGFAL